MTILRQTKENNPQHLSAQQVLTNLTRKISNFQLCNSIFPSSLIQDSNNLGVMVSFNKKILRFENLTKAFPSILDKTIDALFGLLAILVVIYGWNFKIM